MRIIHRPLMLALMFMALICGSLSKPQTGISGIDNVPDDELISLFLAGNGPAPDSSTPNFACGSYEAVKHIPSFTEKIRFNPRSPLKDMGGIVSIRFNPPLPTEGHGAMAAVHFSATNLSSSSHFCGASLISDRYLLTAAHCIVNGRSPVMVSLGREDLNKDPTPGFNTYEIQNHIIHPSYGSGKYGYNDIAILQTKRKVLYKDTIWPFCLPENNEVLDNNLAVQIGGWGQVNSSHSASYVKQAYVKIVENGECESQWQQHAPGVYETTRKFIYPQGLTNQILCAGRLGVDACRGDSGGPLSYENTKGHHTVFGIVSKGINCADIPIVPGFYTNIASYVDWIYSITSSPGHISTIQPTPAPPPIPTPQPTLAPQPTPAAGIVGDQCRSNPCGVGAVCTRGSCTCPPDSIGNPHVSCRKIECQQHSECRMDQTCFAYTCKNPCNTNQAPVCAENAECIPNVHQGLCICKSGYEGDPLKSCTRDFSIPAWVIGLILD
ncbi:unnamed protein product [Meganyctiphanes norvegica]|uniref:Peptidase S1 domain-containing protein n=1 Tax=Meganyctiphanes norvegica TaxID=48144 RepID=A0AAV2S733_MEGNR